MLEKYVTEGEKERRQASLFDPRSSVGRNFVEPRVKVHLLDESYAYIPKNEGFNRRSKGGCFRKSRISS